MGQQVSVEAALPVFRKRCAELNDENLLLKARVDELEERLGQLEGGQPAEPQPEAYGYEAPASVPNPGGEPV